MDVVRKTYKYQEGDIEKSIYIEAKLTMKVFLIIRELIREEYPNAKIEDIFAKISDLDAKVISSLIFNSIQECTEDKGKLIAILDLAGAIDLLGKILKKSMPVKEESEEESLFDDEEEEDSLDWDFSYMDYIWNCVLKRQDDFYNVTPKYYFAMVEHHKKFNGIKDDTEQIEEI